MNDPTTPEPGAEPVEGKPPDATEDAGKKSVRRWPRPLKAAVATFLGLAVTAWLFPAMTRQWDDRQKEHDLKAGIVSDMSTATAHALVGGEAIWTPPPHPSVPSAQLTQIGNQWALSALAIDARLRSYFPGSSVVADWEIYSWAVDRFIKQDNVSMSVALQDAVQNGHLDPAVADEFARLLLEARSKAGGTEPNFSPEKNSATPIKDAETLTTLWNQRYGRSAQGLLKPYIKLDEGAVSNSVYYWSALERTLLDLEQAVANQIVHAHAAGFSTTPGDLLRSLIP